VMDDENEAVPGIGRHDRLVILHRTYVVGRCWRGE